jgi:predicted glycosyltransferase involved in capsule biosynthesis
VHDSTENFVEFASIANNANAVESIITNDISKIFPERKRTCFGGGIVGLSRESVYIIAGWDERFKGRGWEDYAFTAKIMLFLRHIRTFKYNAIHLYHSYKTDDTKDINYKLNNEYQKYTVKDYINQIEKSLNFGSAIKYSYISEHRSVAKCKYEINRKDEDFAYHIYYSIIKKLKKKFKNLSKDQILLYAYLELSGQLERFLRGDEHGDCCGDSSKDSSGEH